MKRTRSPLLVPTVVSLSVLAACATAEPPKTGRFVTSSWARAADSGATGGVYLTVVNADSAAVDLVGASSDVAVSAEIHESMQHDGMMHMMPRAALTIAPRDSVVMAPGGLHVMLNQLTRALVAGDTVALTLRFSNGDSVRVRVPIQAP